jgi:nitric oxide reductase NorQ protein
MKLSGTQMTTVNRPESIIMSDLKWKFLVRTVLRGKNLMITGPRGCGKTLAVLTVANALERPLFRFNLGSTQDPRSSLIGNTHFSKEDGTYFKQSEFVTAIQTPNAVILLDEISRAHPEAWNILLSVIDSTQRYLRIDESPDTPSISVADGVSFIATANIGIEYTATRVLDLALTDRFMVLEMEPITEEQQAEFLNRLFPDTADDNKVLASIYGAILNEVKLENSKISTHFSTRMVIEAASLINDGFTLSEAAEVTIFPVYSSDGGVRSDRTYARQLVQKFIADDTSNPNMF